LPLMRPTANKAIDNERGGWLYGRHFKGRKRLWEMRYQFRLKKPVEGTLFFGILAHRYIKFPHSMLMVIDMVMAAIRKILGANAGIYYSVGDDPSKVKGEQEQPAAVMPLWAFDQLIETPEGEEPPQLNDPEFHNYGVLRATNTKEFMSTLADLELRPGVTYSFGFWGLSPLWDVMSWTVRGFSPGGINFNRFCGAPPVHNVLYSIEQSKTDPRHLESKKNYYFRYSFWSSAIPPREHIVKGLCRVSDDGSGEPRESPMTPPAASSGFFGASFFQDACCVARPRGCH